MNWWLDETPPRQGDVEPFDGPILPPGWSIPDRGDLNSLQDLIDPTANAYRNKANPDPRTAVIGDLIWTRAGTPAGVILSVTCEPPMQYGGSYQFEYVILRAEYDPKKDTLRNGKDFIPRFEPDPMATYDPAKHPA